jgi:GAF domain-containing protein
VAVASDLEPEQAIQRILEQLVKVVPYRTASVQILRDGFLEGCALRYPSEILGVRFPIPGSNPNTIVVQGQRSYISSVTSAEYLPLNEHPHSGVSSWLGVPLIVRDSVIGMLALDHSLPDFYAAEHVRLAEIFASQAAIAIQNARMFQDEKRRTQIIEALADIANEFAATQEMGHLLDKVAQRALELLRASHVAIYLVQNDNQTVKIVAAKGSYIKELLSHTIRGRGLQAAPSRRVQKSNDIDKIPVRSPSLGRPKRQTPGDDDVVATDLQ